MCLSKKLITVILILLVVNISIPTKFYGQDTIYLAEQYVKADVRESQIEVRSTSEEEIEKDKRKKSNWWLWGLLSVVVAGGAAAFAINADGEGGSDDGSSNGGSGTVSW